MKKEDTCSICGRGPHPHDDPECVAGARNINRDAARYRKLRSLAPLLQGKELDKALDDAIAAESAGASQSHPVALTFLEKL